MTKLRRENGSAALEAIASTWFAFLLVSGAIALLLFLFTRTWLQRAAYEATICLAQGTPQSECRQSLKADAEVVLPVGRLVIRTLSIDRFSAKVDLQWILQETGAPSQQSLWEIRVRDELALPLRSKGGSP